MFIKLVIEIFDYGLWIMDFRLKMNALLTMNKILNYEQTSYTLYRSMGRYAI
jgi:hypothetical protein